MTTSALTWATTHQYGANSLAHQFPSFQISAAQVASGNVKVEARSPTNHIQELTVSDTNGVYTANFTPTEVGDWLISILYEGQHIQGSPFNVRVYDAAQVKVFGLEGGSVGKTFSFSADCSGAGDGQLTVDISHNGRSVPVNVHDEGKGLYRVSFTPEGAGIYTIRVYFAGMEVTGSPYTLEIVDSSTVTAVGEGLASVEVNRRATFLVNTHGAAGGDVKVNVTSPRGGPIPAQVFNNGDGTYRVEYVPAEVGEYVVDVLYYGKPINGSPFRVNAFDWNRISINNLKGNCMVGRAVEFDIDAAFAGSGNLEIMVNDGTIPCSVQNRGNRQFHATFTPKEAIPHLIQMKFNGREVPGSPWRVDVKGVTNLNASGPGLQLVSVRQPASFDVKSSGGYPDGNLQVNINSPSRRTVAAQIVPNHGGFRVEYIPAEVGNHQIDVLYEGVALPGSPFHSKAYDTAAILVSNINNGIVGKPVEFTIDVNQAGEGQLEIMVNRGSVPNTVKMLRKGEFLVSFVPKDPRPHVVNIKFNGELLPRCPINVPILDASRVTVQGEGIRQVAVNKSSYFRVNTQSAGDADLAVRVTAPSGRVAPAKITGSGASGFDVELQMSEVGTHRVDIEYASMPVPGSPFYVKAYDAQRVVIQGIGDGIVGQRSSFTVDVNEAGEGNMEISIQSNGRNIQNHVRQQGPGKFEVSYTPTEGTDHQASITFNGQNVAGSPYHFKVTDASRINATGDGLDLVPCGKAATFNIAAPGAKASDLQVDITGASGRPVGSPAVREMGGGNFMVEWVPNDVGEHKIDVKYFGVPINGSPFTARAWDASKVSVKNIKPGRVTKPYNFNIDASRAGAGNLEIIVSVSGDNVPNFVNSQGNANFEVSFTPQVADTHMISVKFNGEVVPGSPFYCNMMDGSKATASGEGLRLISANRLTTFTVNTHGIGDATLDVEIVSPSGRPVPSRVSGNPSNGYEVTYTPTEVGRHMVHIKYADMAIGGSPFPAEVFDANLVRVGHIPDGLLGKPVNFDVDCTMAGEGTLTVDVRGQATTSAYPQINQKGNSRFEVSFIPREDCPHIITVTFNGERVPGSPFTCQLYDPEKIHANWDKIRNIPVGRPASFDVDPGGAPDGRLHVRINDPDGKEIPNQLTRYGASYRVEFTPQDVGNHFVSAFYAEQDINGSPHTCYAYDISRVRIVDATATGKVNSPLSFTVDTTASGPGEIDVEVVLNGQVIRTQRERIDDYHTRFSFLAPAPGGYTAKVTFNREQIPGGPLVMNVVDPLSQLTLASTSPRIAAVDQLAWSVIQTQGAKININDVSAIVKAPNGDLVPAKIVQQPDSDYKVEYSSKYTGRHTVEILYAGQAIMGSPFYVEIYDPNKIRVQGVTNGNVGESMAFDIIRHEAGKADLQLTITSPSGMNVPYNISSSAKGEHVTYVASESGPHSIYITYGGLDVPGCPLTQNIGDGGSVNAYGDGLVKGEEGKPATFFVDTQGKRGDLFVQVDGPNSIAKCNIDPDSNGQYLVTYVPVEVGIYNITIKWNGREIQGGPYQPKIVDTRKVRVVGGWQSILDNNNSMGLTVNQSKKIEFECYDAGPGKLTAEARGPNGTLPVEIQQRGNGHYLLSFSPRTEGEHTLSIWYSEVPLPNSPFRGYAGGMGTAINHEKVILTGHGLQEAHVKEEAEFVIDGTDAGPGQPGVTLTGVKSDIDVQVQPLGGNKYRCTYSPQLPGAYLLNIRWSDRQVRGSPFKVNVSAQSDASKVMCTGEGLKVGIIGKEIKSVIDTRRAGPGELTAHCMGPHKVAYCELYDHRDGTFTLNVKPQEAGRHVLQVKYGGQNVPGSPFVLRVSGAPDASKVRVTGPGIEHGILAMYQSRFIVETRGAGAGQLTVRIRGPKGAFRVEMQRESQKDRTILCRYDPTEVGDYIIHIKWSGVHVPGSPFHVQIFDTQDELERFATENPHHTNTMVSDRSWNTDI